MIGRFLCWVGRHQWEYTFGNFDGQRVCARCSLSQPLFKEFGKWFV